MHGVLLCGSMKTHAERTQGSSKMRKERNAKRNLDAHREEIVSLKMGIASRFCTVHSFSSQGSTS